MDIKQIDGEYIAHTYNRFPIQLSSGNGSLVFDENGNEYIDMGSGIAVNIFGIADKQWQQAVTEQLSSLQHTSNLYYSEPCALLAKELCVRTGMKKVFFSNSGAEANECAIKAARKYAADKKGAKCCKIITLINSFHGRTITTLAATGQDSFHKDFQPLTPGFVYARANDIDDIKQKISENDGEIAAIMFECVQGEGGVLPLEPEFISAIAEIAKTQDILLITDEVQTGNGRSGKLYAYMNFDITPDIVTTAKGLGGGLPLGACMLGEKVSEVFTPGTHGSTFGGNPVCCAGALNILSRLDDKLMNDVKAKSDYICTALNGKQGIKAVSGMGLMLGIETVKPAAQVVAECMKNGVLVLTAHSKVRLLPALNIEQKLLEKAIDTIIAACAD